MPLAAAGTLETLLVPVCFLEEGAPGASKEGREGIRRRRGRVCTRNGWCLPWMELDGGSLLEGPDRARQQGAPMRKAGRGSVISGILLFSTSGSLSGTAQEEGVMEPFQAVGPGWGQVCLGGGGELSAGPRAFLVFLPLLSV